MPREPRAAPAPSIPSAACIATGAFTGVAPSASEYQADVPATRPPVGAATTEVTPPARATGIDTDAGL